MLEHARGAARETIGETGGTATSHIADRIKQNVLAGDLGPQALSQFNAADTEEARFRVQLNLLDELQRKGELLAKFDPAKTFFGASFETQLRNGVDMIGRMRAALDGLQSAGGERIIPEKEIQNAQRMQKELDEINNTIAKVMRPILENIAAIHQEDLATLISMKEASRFRSHVRRSCFGAINSYRKHADSCQCHP